MRKFYLFLLFIVFSSCSNEDYLTKETEIPSEISVKENINVRDLSLSSDTLISVSKKINELTELSLSKKMSSAKMSEEIQVAVSPFIENGEEIRKKLLQDKTLSEDDYEYLKTARSEDLAQLSIFISALNVYDESNVEYSMNARLRPVDDRIKSCLAVAVGITGAYDLIKNTKKLMTVRTAVKALRLIGRRYLGWVGVGLMVYDFVDCYNG